MEVIRLLLLYVMLHSVTCGKSFERNLTEEGSISMKEVKEYVQGIQSVFNQERKHEIDQLKYMIYSQGKKIANLEEEDRVHQKMISKLETRVASLEEVNKEQMETAGGDVLNEGNRNVGHDFLRRVRRSAEENKVAFSASITKANNGPGPIIFDQVSVNLGTGYDDKSGIFSVRVAGTYVLYFSLQCSPNARGNICVNGKPVGKQSIGQGQASQMAIVNLKIGNLVSINKETDTQYSNDGSCTFIGFLLYGTPGDDLIG